MLRRARAVDDIAMRINILYNKEDYYGKKRGGYIYFNIFILFTTRGGWSWWCVKS